jgi:Flp pilus assembly protein TadB
MGFISEITRNNITHLENGRKPEAGASIFPTIPLVPAGVVLFAWILNQLHQSLGFYTIIVLFFVYAVFWTISHRKARRQLAMLKKKRKG